MTLKRSEFEDVRIAVLGMARTGMAAAPVLSRLGARVILSDMLTESELGATLERAKSFGVDLRPGASPEEALDGAEMVVPSPGIRPDSDVLTLARERGIPILSEIEIAYRIAQAPIIAVTGTNGKTTTTVLLGDMIRDGGKRAWVAGNVAADDIKLPLIQAAAEAGSNGVIVAEISSFQLMWVEKFRPHIGILTNISPDHLNWHDSFSEYVNAKARLFSAQSSEDVAILNAVNAPSRKIAQNLRAQLFWFDHGHCMGDDSACVKDGEMTVRWRGQEHRLGAAENLKIPGKHNMENALAAAGAAIAFGISPESVAETLRTFRGVVHRMEHVVGINGVSFINNSMCTNVDAAVCSLEAMDRPTIVIAGGVDKKSDFVPLGAAIQSYAKGLVLIGVAADQIEAAARSAGFRNIRRAKTLEEAVEIAASMADPGDAVMLSPACASFDMFADFEARGEAFRQAVRRRISVEV